MALTLSLCILQESYSIVFVIKDISFLSPSVSMQNLFMHVSATLTIMHKTTYKTLLFRESALEMSVR